MLGHGDGKVEATGSGDGMIDAAIAAISEATGVHGKVGNFQVSSVTGGSDALGAVAITVEAEGRKVTGRGVATDVVEASARAYLNAVNKIVRLRERGDVRDESIGRAVDGRDDERQPVGERRARDRLPASGATRSRTAPRRYAVLFEILPRARRPRARPRHRRRLHARARARGASRTRPASASTSRTRCSTGRATGSPATRASRSAQHDLDEPLPAISASSTSSCRASRSTTSCPSASGRSTARCSTGSGPGGVFANVEHVASHDRAPPRGVPLRRSAAAPTQDDPSNKLVPVETHLAWLNALGFADAECLWKWRELAVVTGTKPGS